ncbi:hypothetical protein Acr_21g0005460 [Actinidia rufa]|uniref:Uncharacterized protein n=1 Tax=Actinidia rufa TaxID=165716 RepID=A0A7J0GGJ5_9ERIC|nr:hypothetical protein Acr_21g0005460 [Actinidia rufa]
MRTPFGDKGVHGNERPLKKANGFYDAHLTSPKKKSPAKKSGIPLFALVAAEQVILAQLATTSTRPAGRDRHDLEPYLSKTMSWQLNWLSLPSFMPTWRCEIKWSWTRVKELTEEKGRENENFDLTKRELEKEIAELVEKENGVIEVVELAKVSTLVELKASEGYSEALTLEASKFYSEGFALCKKQIKLHFPNLNIDDLKIDLDLAEEVDEGEVDGDATLADDPPMCNQNSLGKKEADYSEQK